MSALQITQTKSLIGCTAKQRATIEGLGLRRMRHTVVKPDRPEIRGMLAAVQHLVEWVEVDDAELPPAADRSPRGSRKAAAAEAAAGSEPEPAAPTAEADTEPDDDDAGEEE